MTTRVFPAKISWWLFGPILALLLGNAAYAVLAGEWLKALIPLSAGAFVAFLLLSTRYTLTDAELHVTAGPFAWRVPVQSITRIRPTHNPLSSPAPSLDRLEISYHTFNKLLISPRDKAAFVAALQQLNPAIVLE
ncbi:PH domain-containing protein [Hymenobacter chitinivorans]|uniref:PH (Pleckstrin Homology) domain-containing protein n=1 Tax=Hymenobacter chitinivorans DSM 11115 TaxID=1121954 RepID=A0A2M9BSR7_9BACT|nr:PH domain-containing protein [Hymenobacter chitinivorans]PJJ60998.1 PH (Pleckstrin Homology) domain-containing protein [Hymenobacter chitinivorans DSM 11115]